MPQSTTPTSEKQVARAQTEGWSNPIERRIHIGKKRTNVETPHGHTEMHWVPSFPGRGTPPATPATLQVYGIPLFG